MLITGTKAQVLAALKDRLAFGRVLPLHIVRRKVWAAERAGVLRAADESFGREQPIVVRSSCVDEDVAGSSHAGVYRTHLNVIGREAIAQAIGDVFDSYSAERDSDEVLLQPCISHVSMSGVAFTRDPQTGAPYLTINYDEVSGRTDTVTSGITNAIRTYTIAKCAREAADPRLSPVIRLALELERITGFDCLDFEFAIRAPGELPILFQVRPLAVGNGTRPEPSEHRALLSDVAGRIGARHRPPPSLQGTRAIFGVMPDWNPAEIIGVRPSPLALSLYKFLLMDSAWAEGRARYGYRSMLGFPLLFDIYGLPYIDVRVSFNSFIPAELDRAVARKLIGHYLARLSNNPWLHDKVEFEIVFSCYTFDLKERIHRALQAGFSNQEIQTIISCLNDLTKRICQPGNPIVRRDVGDIERLSARHRAWMDAKLDSWTRLYWLLEDCRRLGAVPFAGLARVGFIAVELLRSLAAAEVLNEQDINAVLASVGSITSEMQSDLTRLNRRAFLKKYGHLRPGTYDIRSRRYDQAPDQYFEWPARGVSSPLPPSSMRLSAGKLRDLDQALARHGFEMNAEQLLKFIRDGVRQREWAKFVFSRNLSDALKEIEDVGARCGFDVEALSYADVSAFLKMYSSCATFERALSDSIETGKRQVELANQITLPPTITSSADVWSFHHPPSDPNFITRQVVVGPVVTVESKARFEDAIIMMPSADPGFDWIFTHRIAGFATMYGGANSHMAIRASELQIPAVIGVGEQRYAQWRQARVLQLDCRSQRVAVLA
jgi:phosphohistidine swiveling domain-containing protein